MKNKNFHPIRLDNDHIIESIVKIDIITDYNSTFLTHRLLQVLNNDVTDVFTRKDLTNNEGIDYCIFSNSKFSFVISTDNISFNCVDQYQGWNEYRAFIKLCIEVLSEMVKEFSGLRLRYISLFENISIFEKLNGKVTLNAFPDFENINLSFDFLIEGNKRLSISRPIASVKAQNRIPVHGNDFASIVDISLESSFQYFNPEVVMRNIDHCHEQEKNIFFSFISQEFINELGPTY